MIPMTLCSFPRLAQTTRVRRRNFQNFMLAIKNVKARERGGNDNGKKMVERLSRLAVRGLECGDLSLIISFDARFEALGSATSFRMKFDSGES